MDTSGFPVLHCLPEFLELMFIELVMSSNHLISVAPFSCCPQSFLESGSFPVNWLFASGGQSIGASASESVLPVNIQGWFPLGLTGSISLQSKDSQESSLAPQLESVISLVLSLLMVHLSHLYITTRKTIAFTRQTLVGKVLSDF